MPGTNLGNLIFVDWEATGPSAWSGTLTEFGAVSYASRATFHGRLFESTPDPVKPVVPIVGKRIASAIRSAIGPSVVWAFSGGTSIGILHRTIFGRRCRCMTCCRPIARCSC